eukprot:1310470-Alexandrium_andersonii.AAC.1
MENRPDAMSVGRRRKRAGSRWSAPPGQRGEGREREPRGRATSGAQGAAWPRKGVRLRSGR